MSEGLRRPDELAQLDLGRSAVIEASAGTGKTYLLEHLVLELLISGRARLDEILVVTFTERATAELVVRIRQKIDQALAAGDGTAATLTPPAPGGWIIDQAARVRLGEARRSFDQATIATIHAFCQRILTDEPLTTGRLLAQTQVEGQAAFGEAFREVLRHELATTTAHTAYLTGYLANRRGVGDLEELLYRAATARGDWANPFDEDSLRRLCDRLAHMDLEAANLEGALCKRGMLKVSVNAMMKRLRRLVPEAQAATATGGWGRLLACFDAEADLFRYFETMAGWGDHDLPAVLAPLRQVAALALDAAPPLDHAIAQRFLPLVEAKLQQRKLAEGLYDYDDMIRGVDAALAGAHGAALSDSLRRRYKFALVDEAQDTEAAQWRIFRRVFLESDGPNPLVLIGDPKQAIYGFRGADVHTYVQAREEIRARGGVVLPLARNFRSHPEVVAAYNAILDQAALPPYFSGAHIGYDHPVTAAKPPLGDGPGVTLFQVEVPSDATPGTPARIGAIRQALREAIVAAVEGLRVPGRGVRLSEIFVLTRSNSEAREVAARLHASGIANVLFKPDDIFGSAEAEHARALLLAIADPADRAARLAAWLTPFFDVPLDQLANWADPPPAHPLISRLVAWKGLADAHAYDQLWARILDDSGVARRLRFSPAGLRRLTNYRHLFDILHAAAVARPLSVADLAALLGAFAAGQRRAQGGDGEGDDGTQRLETEADAIRVMTIHAAKGLEADYVFIYGGLTGARFWRGLHALQRQQQRLRCAGKPRRQCDADLIDAARQEEAQRLLYVAMTRARKHLYLPFFPATEAGDPDGQSERASGDFDPFRKISGEYRHVNERLRVLTRAPQAAALFQRQTITLRPEIPAPAPAALEHALAAWVPPPGSREEDAETEFAVADDLAQLRARRRGFALTSYSRLSEAEGGYQPPRAKIVGGTDNHADGGDLSAGEHAMVVAGLDPLERLDIEMESGAPAGEAAAAVGGAVALPGGLASGLFLHAILEKVPVGEEIAPLAVWRAQPEVRRLIEAESRRWEREPRHFDEAARLVHAALTVPIVMPDGSPLPGMARAARMRREVDFLFPLPTAAATGLAAPGDEERLVHERGFVRGALDVVFEHGGRVCFADWKSNVLPDFSAAAVREHVATNYELQVRIYTLAVVRLLGIANRAHYDQRFGGLVYLFLRGLPTTERPAAGPPHRAGVAACAHDDGLYIHRPDYSDVEKWNDDLITRHVAGAGDDS